MTPPRPAAPTPPTLETARLVLRPLVLADAAALHAVYSDVEAMRWWSHQPHATFEQTRERVATNLANTEWRPWAITRRGGEDRALGTIAAHEERQGRVFEIGYSLARAEWGGGLAREAVSGLLAQMFEAEGARRVFADTDPDNVRSIALLERLGFVREGLLRGHWETHLGVRDSIIWGLLAEDWKRACRPT